MIDIKLFSMSVFFLLATTSFSQSNTEQITESWLDSAFMANNINWDETKSEFLAFSKTNFKKSASIADFLVALKESASPKHEKAPDLISENFNLLQSVTESIDLLQPLEQHILSVIIAEGNWCTMDNYKYAYLSIRYINYYAPENFGIYALASRLINLNYKLESVSLHEKLAVMIILQKIYADSAPKSVENLASEKRNQFTVTVCDVNSSYDQNADSTFETTADEQEPCFLGNEEGMIQFIREMVQYPELSREMAEQGVVYVQFIVNADGTQSDLCILKSPSDLLSKEAIRVISSMPKWSPGYQNGKAVRVRYQIPIRFSIS